MADVGFNGSTITFGGAQALMRSIRYSGSEAKVDVSSAVDTFKLYEGGLGDFEVTFDLVGGTVITIGETSAVDINWNDGGGHDGSIVLAAGTWVCIGVEVGGDMDGEITSSVTVVPHTVAAI